MLEDLISHQNLISQDWSKENLGWWPVDRSLKNTNFSCCRIICCLLGSRLLKLFEKVLPQCSIVEIWSDPDFLFCRNLCFQMNKQNIGTIPPPSCCTLTFSSVKVFVCHSQKNISLCWFLWPCGLWKTTLGGAQGLSSQLLRLHIAHSSRCLRVY